MTRQRARSIVVAAAVSLLVAACGGGSSEDDAGPRIEPEASAIQAAATQAMVAVESVRFELDRTGEPVHIDPANLLALDAVVGRYAAPAGADALVSVTINGSLRTELGAVSLDGDVWLSNPITGEFEPLPAGYDIDPIEFFDPANGWAPLLRDLTDVEFVGEDDRGGTRYVLRAVAPSHRVDTVTAGLVDDQDVTVDLWIDPVTGLITSLEFDTLTGTETTVWRIDLSQYGETFTIEAPDG